MILEDYLRVSLLRRSNPLPLAKLQIHLLQDLVGAEKAVQEYKKDHQPPPASPQSNPASSVAGEDAAAPDVEAHPAKMICNALRDIADGIAWRVFEYDRSILHEFARRPSAKHINIGGLDAEIGEFRNAIMSLGAIAILNDLTHYLKLGDITVRTPEGDFEILEVKKGRKTSGRITRQRQELHRTVEFFNRGERSDEAGRVVIQMLDVTPETYTGIVRRLTGRAEADGAAVEQVGSHLIVEGIDLPRAVEVGEGTIARVVGPARERIESWRRRGDFVLDCWSLDQYLHVQNYAPFSVFPVAESVRVKMMTGTLWVMAFVNICEVLRYFEQRGWKVVKRPEERSEEAEKHAKGMFEACVTVQKGPLSVDVPWTWMGRLGFEFLRPRSLVEALEAGLSAGPPGAERTITGFRGEGAIWD